MGRFRDSSEGDSDATIDMAPLIDCMFILLIFFIVTTSFVEESGVKVEKQQPGQPLQQTDKTTVVITLTEKGEVTCDGKVIGLGGVQRVVKTALQKEQVPIVVQADGGSMSGTLVRIVDEARLAGAEDVNLAANYSRK